jgi:predicted ATPase
LRDRDYYGPAVNRVARLLGIAHGGQTLLTQASRDLCRDALPQQVSLKRLGEHALKDLAHPEVVYQLGHPSLREEFPESRPLAPKPVVAGLSRVGSPASSLVDILTDLPPLYGRADDLAAVCRLIRSHSLVTVVGTGGIGKTRLAQAVELELRDEFPDGVRMVELAPITDPLLVGAAVARALGVSTGDPQRALDLAVHALAGQRLLLVLDNCEHLMDSVERVVAAFRKGAPSVRILATSQELLRHPEEQVYRLDTLALPAESTTQGARDAGAVQLFVARASAADPRFQLDDSNVAAVVDICRRLDGIPLAIELAAARVPLLGVDGVRERLDERFRLLTAGSRLALRRHQTLRAALEWSYGLLSEQEQVVFDRLGIFAGGFSLNAAQQLASDDTIDGWAVLDHLGALVDKSLVIADGGNVRRHRMLETTRAFALERLSSRGETPSMLRRHAEVVLGLCESFFRDNLDGLPVGAQVIRLGADLDNLRSAIAWACDTDGDPRIAIAMVGALGAGRGFLTNAGLTWEGWRWCKSMRSKVDATIPTADAARFWLACAELGVAASLDDAIADAQQAIALYRDSHDRQGEFLSLGSLAYALDLAGRFDDAQHALGRAEALLDPSWPTRLRAMHENQAGLHFQSAAQPDESRAHLGAYLALSRQMGSEEDELTAASLLGDLDIVSGHAERAIAALREPIARLRDNTARYHDGMAIRNYAAALLANDQLQEAEAAFREALPSVRRTFGTGAFVLQDAALLLARRGQYDDAARVSAYAVGIYAAMGRKPRAVALLNHERLSALLAAELPEETLARLGNEGRALTDDEVCLLAFPPATSDES